MATTLESWDTMTQLQHARRRAVIAGAATIGAVVVVALLVVKLWPDGSSPSRETRGGPDIVLRKDATGLELPVSRSAGPLELSAGLAKGFAQSELGAALAAVHISIRAAAGAGPSIFEPTIRDQVTGPNRESLLARVRADYEADRSKLGLPEGRPLPRTEGRVLAYDIVRYSDTDARVTAVSGVARDATKFFAFDLEVRWLDGDWRLVAPSEGTFATALRELPSIPADAVMF